MKYNRPILLYSKGVCAHNRQMTRIYRVVFGHIFIQSGMKKNRLNGGFSSELSLCKSEFFDQRFCCVYIISQQGTNSYAQNGTKYIPKGSTAPRDPVTRSIQWAALSCPVSRVSAPQPPLNPNPFYLCIAL